VAEDASSKAEEVEDFTRRRQDEHGFGELRFYVPQGILDASFPVSVRGYDRGTVDAYAKRVNRVIAELKVRASPQAAVRHALEQAEEKVQGLLDARAAAARDGREHAIRLLDELSAGERPPWTLVDAAWTPNSAANVSRDNGNRR
jgi:hypothetical protein